MPHARKPGPWDTTPAHPNTLRAEIHTSLDEIITHIEQGNSSGGEAIIHDMETGKQYRVTLCDWTGETICGVCDGTGSRQHSQLSRN